VTPKPLDQAARSLRQRQTDAEIRLWRHLRNRDLAGHKYRRQVPLGPYVVDFLCFEARLIVEADGGQHADNQNDKERDAYFKARGYRTLRVWNADILRDTEAVPTLISLAIKEQSGDC
jgi:2-isopropylmalate synthase